MAREPATERPSQAHKRSARYLEEVKALGERVRALRRASGWTLESVAERCDLDLKHLQKIEAGRLNVTLVTLVRLSKGFGLPIGTFFPNPDPPRSDRTERAAKSAAKSKRAPPKRRRAMP